MKKQQQFKGKVVSAKTEKTVIVEVSRYVKHPKYKKFIKKVNRIPAHTTSDDYVVGQEVIIQPTRPMSKTKRFIVVNAV